MKNKGFNIILVLSILLLFNPYLLMGQGEQKNLGLNSLDHQSLNQKNGILLSLTQDDVLGEQTYLNDEKDQYQENDDGYEKIYGGISYAQSFTPSKGILTQLEVKIGVE